MSVLFVDDEPHVLRGLERMLDVADFEWDCDFAASGAEALEILKQGQFEVIVTDMRMPGMNGAELLEHVARTHPDMVRIVLSGEADRTSVLKAVGPMHQYLAKPCDPSVLKATLQQALQLRNTLKRPALREAISRLPSLPSIPESYARLTEMMQDDDCDLSRIGALLEQDVAMTAKTLQVVNSAHIGLKNKVTSPRQGVALLGLSVIRGLVLSTAVFESYADARLPHSFSTREQSEHAFQVARLSQQIAQAEQLGNEEAGLAFTAGILHDVGKLVLASARPDQYEAAIQQSRRLGLPIGDAERELFGVDHADVGAYLLSVWGLAQSTVEIVGLHHRPERPATATLRATDCVIIANLIHHEASDDSIIKAVPHPAVRNRLSEWKKLADAGFGISD